MQFSENWIMLLSKECKFTDFPNKTAHILQFLLSLDRNFNIKIKLKPTLITTTTFHEIFRTNISMISSKNVYTYSIYKLTLILRNLEKILHNLLDKLYLWKNLYVLPKNCLGQVLIRRNNINFALLFLSILCQYLSLPSICQSLMFSFEISATIYCKNSVEFGNLICLWKLAW